MARVRHVHKKDMVAHLWAHKAQDSARNAGGNFYFDRETIYSYGSHFPIARHVASKRGAAVLFTTRDYSVSTSAHKSIVRSACRHLTVFHVRNVESAHHAEQFADYRAQFIELARKYSRARSNKPWYLASLRQTVEEANQFAQFFALRSRLTMPSDSAAMAAECQAIEKREEARRKLEDKRHRALAEKREREREALRQEALVSLDQWANGATDNLDDFRFYDLPTRLRIKGDTLETSRGAEVPLDHAVKAFRIIKRLHDSGETYLRNGHTIHLGHFALDSVDGQGTVRAGCHTVAWPEMERVAALAGVN